jgi:A/G-specific adenine glycosylase
LPILEANTKRLWSRFLGQTDRPDLPAASKVLWEAAERCLPKVGAREFNWALMDLGAAVCKPKNPDCNGCPLRSDCRAAASDDPERFPAPPTKSRKNRRREVALVLRRQDQLLLRKRTEPGRYRHFWELPVCDARSGEDLRRTADRLLSEVSPVGIDFARQPIRLRYGIVNEIVELSGFIAESDLGVGADRSMSANYRWVSDLELAALPLSSPQRRLLKLAGWLRTE